MITQGQTTIFKQTALNAVFGSGHVFKLALYTANATLNSTTTAYTTIGEVIGTGYTSGGAVLTNFVNGTGLYTSNFVPPINSYNTAVANTTLLTLQTNGPGNNNGFIDSSQFGNVITRGGLATQGTFSPYNTGWSNYFTAST